MKILVMKKITAAARLGWLAIAAATLFSPVTLHAAGLRLREQCTPTSPLVRLGDVAEITGTDAAETASLAAVELFPTPTGPQPRLLRVRELQDLLVLRGVNLTQHEFSGSSQIAVQGKAAAQPQALRPIAPATARRVQTLVSEAVAKYLDEQSPTRQAWTVEIELGDVHVRALTERAQIVSISGGNPPWTGMQVFQVTANSPGGPVQFNLQAQVGVRAAVVVTTRSIPRGEMVREGDVELQQIASAEKETGLLHRLEDAIGRETTRSVAAGRPLPADSLRSPLMVRRGEVVTVYVNNGGIRIHTTARARDDGGQGDLVSVESVLDRSKYFARVSGVREVEIFARAPRAEQAEAGGAETIVRR